MPRLSSPEQRLLLDLVRGAVRAQLSSALYELPALPEGPLHDPLGVFVSIHRGVQLRGCIGRVSSDRPLYESAVECGVFAATSDPRFPPLVESELGSVAFEISVLSAPEPSRPESVEVGRHGLVVERGTKRGLLLPQVASAQGWDRSEFVRQTCLKAGLGPEFGPEPMRLFTFEALVFSETDPV